VLARLDPLLREPVPLAADEIEALVDFVRDGLLDPDARPERLRRLIPERLPSGRPGLTFQHSSRIPQGRGGPGDTHGDPPR
jgi:hypothetical protein